MAARASMRAGAGYVTALRARLAAGVVARRGHAGADDPGAAGGRRRARARRASSRCWRRPRAAARWRSARASGAARGRSRFARRARTPRRRLPLVLDADGLNAHAGRLAESRRREAPDGAHAARRRARAACWSSTAARSSASACATCARRPSSAGAVVVLKGDDTLVADPAGRGRGQPRAQPGAGHRGHRRRAHRRDRGAARAGPRRRSRRPRRACWLHARAGREAARRHGRRRRA